MDLHPIPTPPSPSEVEAVLSVLGPDGAEPVGLSEALGLRHLLLPVLHALQARVGWISPGGLGVSDGMLATLPVELLGLPVGEVAATSMLIRGATLWLGVLLGALALFAVDPMLRRPRQA